ncbi:hypothetical protein [Parashewanella tropica]|uniref:hypothetical protein n=1 Tax=Parashewanella tropica TaxID=2547970 RepID=UPI00105A5AC9|nr:hypothetical protein [Parashewanella tropica]
MATEASLTAAPQPPQINWQAQTSADYFDPNTMTVKEFSQRTGFKTIRSELLAHLNSLSSTLSEGGLDQTKLEKLERLIQLVKDAPSEIQDHTFAALFGEFCVEMTKFDQLFNDGTFVEHDGISKFKLLEQQIDDFNIDNPHLANDLKRINQQLNTLNLEAHQFEELSEKAFRMLTQSEDLQAAIIDNLDQLPDFSEFSPNPIDDYSQQLQEHKDQKIKQHQDHLAYVLSDRIGFTQSETPDTLPVYFNPLILQLLNCVKTNVFPNGVIV